MELQGLTAVLAGTFRSMRRAEARRRLEACGARVTGAVSGRTDLVFAGHGATPRALGDARDRGIPVYDEDALLWLTERAEAPDASGEPPGPAGGGAFVDRAALLTADGPAALRTLLETADWAAFVPAQDLPPLRRRLAELEREHGVTEVHRLATRGLRGAAGTRLLHPYGHEVEISAFALSPCGGYLATGSWVGDDYAAGGVLQIWEVAAGRCVNTLRGIEGGVGWPDHARTIQWSADSARIAMNYRTSAVGVWDPFLPDAEPVASAAVSDGGSRPAEFALSPDGLSVYVRTGSDGRGGLQGCVLPMGRGHLSWLPGRHPGGHPFTLGGPLPSPVREAFAEQDARAGDETGFRVGQWVERPVWSPDGSRLLGTNAIGVDVPGRRPLWYEPTAGEPAAYSPDGRVLAHATDDGLRFRDAETGRPLGDPFVLGTVSSLHWVMVGRTRRLAAVVLGGPGTARCVHVFDDGRHRCSVDVPHPEREYHPWRGDDTVWAWAPEGERGACLTEGGRAELWSFAGTPPRRLRVLPMPEGTVGVLWGAGDTVVAVGPASLRFVRASDGVPRGDFVFLREPEAPRPLRGEVAEELFGERIFALDDTNWGVVLEPGAVIAPPGREADLDALLCWSVGRRYAWPLRWGETQVLPDVRSAADRLESEDGEILRSYRDLLISEEGEPAPWPPPQTAGPDLLFAAALAAAAGPDRGRWSRHVSEQLRAAARLSARRGAAAGSVELVRAVPAVGQRVAAAADVAVILARGGRPEAAREAFTLAEADIETALARREGVADVASSFGAACHLLKGPDHPEGWFARARAAIGPGPGTWPELLAVIDSLLECGREEEARAVWARPERLPAGSGSQASWLVHLVRSGRLAMAGEFLALPGWELPYEVLTELAEQGRPDLLHGWVEHDWYVPEELAAHARAAAAFGTAPVRPLTPSPSDIEDLERGHAHLRGTPRAKRRQPLEELIDRAAACGHLSAVLDLLPQLPVYDFEDRPRVAFRALWRAVTGHLLTPW